MLTIIYPSLCPLDPKSKFPMRFNQHNPKKSVKKKDNWSKLVIFLYRMPRIDLAKFFMDQTKLLVASAS